MRIVTFPLSLMLLSAICATSVAAQQSGTLQGQEVRVDAGVYRDVTVAEYRTVADDEDVLLINVHIPFEGDLPNTDASIAFNEIAAHIAHVAPEKDAEIVLYCRSGRMSTSAAAELVKLGYTRVHNLVGGFNAWVAAGLPMADR